MSHFLRLIFSVVRRFNEHACPQRAASLSFTSLLALAPGLTIALSVFAISPYFADIALAVRQFLLSNLVPEAAGRMTTLYLEQFVRHAGRLTIWEHCCSLPACYFYCSHWIKLSTQFGESTNPALCGGVFHVIPLFSSLDQSCSASLSLPAVG